MDAKLDQTADRNFTEFYRYAKLYPLPDYVKTASTEDTCQPGNVPAAAYADVRTPAQFPCHNKAATYVSWIYFLEKKSQFQTKVAQKIEERLGKFADAWGIKKSVDVLRAKHAELHSDSLGSLPDSAFAYVWASDDGVKDRRYPLRNALEVKAAADWFAENRDQLAFDDRSTIANKIVEKAAKFGANVGVHSEMLERQAGRGFCNIQKVAEMLRKRVTSVETIPELKEKFALLAKSIEDSPHLALNNSVLLKLAGTIDQFDRQAGVKYSSSTPRVEDVLFETTFKSASELVSDTCTTTTGSVYDRSQFEKLSLVDIRGLFGNDLADTVASGLSVDVDKLAELAATFPRPDAERLDDLMRETGQAPLYKRAAATRIGFTTDQLFDMAR